MVRADRSKVRIPGDPKVQARTTSCPVCGLGLLGNNWGPDPHAEHTRQQEEVSEAARHPVTEAEEVQRAR